MSGTRSSCDVTLLTIIRMQVENLLDCEATDDFRLAVPLSISLREEAGEDKNAIEDTDVVGSTQGVMGVEATVTQQLAESARVRLL